MLRRFFILSHPRTAFRGQRHASSSYLLAPEALFLTRASWRECDGAGELCITSFVHIFGNALFGVSLAGSGM